MRGLDTNVLVRFLTADDPVQSPLAKQVLRETIERREVLHISPIALCELLWTLRSSPYSYGREALAGVVEKLLATNVFRIGQRDAVRWALERFRGGRADFADYLIGRLDAQAGSRDTLTFDRRLAREEGFTLVSEAQERPVQTD